MLSVYLPCYTGQKLWHCIRAQTQLKKLESYYISSLQSILDITWKDKVTHNVICRKIKSISILYLVAQRQLRWTGHMVIMDDERLPKQVLYGNLAVGHRLTGRQKKRCKDSTKETLKKCHIPLEELEKFARDRNGVVKSMPPRAESTGEGQD